MNHGLHVGVVALDSLVVVVRTPFPHNAAASAAGVAAGTATVAECAVAVGPHVGRYSE